MQLFGGAYVAAIVKDSSLSYGVFALVLGLLAWTFAASIGVIASAEINVVLSKRLYPRSLLTPFTDDVDLTVADQRTYTDQATAQRQKGFQDVDVTFEHRGQNATAQRASGHPHTATPAEPAARANGSRRSAGLTERRSTSTRRVCDPACRESGASAGRRTP